MGSRRSRSLVLGVFGGAFDPPHLGHALVPAYLRLRGLVDRVVMVPCADHPLGKSLSPLPWRIALVRAAVAPLGEGVQVSDIEARLHATHGGPSYTLRMLEALAAEHPDATIRLVVGTDILAQAHRWHRWEEIERRFAPIVIPRAGHALPDTCALPEVSSTQVRAWLDEGGPVAERGLAASVPAAVRELLRRSESSGVVWLVGGGHVAAHAGPWLQARGWTVELVGARALVEAKGSRPEGDPSGVWVLARDPAIHEVADALADCGLSASVPVLHAAGARRAREVLAPLSSRGHPVGTLHPICSLRNERPSPSPLPEAAFGIEGDPEARSLARAWVGEQPWLDLERLDVAARAAYHAACSLAANHLAVPYAGARDVLVGQGHDPGAVGIALATLMRSALDNLLALGLPAGVTGPVARGDEAAVEAHVAALDPPTAALYRTLSQRLAEIVARGRSR